MNDSFLPPKIPNYLFFSNYGLRPGRSTVKEIQYHAAKELRVPQEAIKIEPHTPGMGIRYAAYVAEEFHHELDIYDSELELKASIILGYSFKLPRNND